MEWKYALIFESKEDLDQAEAKLKAGTNPSSQKKIDHPEIFICTDCKKMIPENVAKYSQKWYGKHLCRDCQLKHEKKENE